MAGRWPTCLIKCSNGLLGRRRSQSLKCLGLFLGLLHGKKCEILLTFCNNLLKRKNYKAIWEATPRPASVVFGGGFPPLEKQARNSSGPLETGGLERPSRANPQRRGCCRAERELRDGDTAPYSTSGCQGPRSLDSARPNARDSGQVRAVWVPAAWQPLTVAERAKGACGFQHEGGGCGSETSREREGAFCLALHPAASPGHRRPAPAPLPGAAWCLGHAGGSGPCSRLPIDIAW